MSLHLMIALIGLLYILIFGGMALLRREGLSVRFAVESICITAIAVILVYLTPIQIHPVIFLIVIYAITLRTRILVDLANTFAGRKKNAQAEKIYHFASRLWPDQTGELIIKVNHATLLLQMNKLDESISEFKQVLAPENEGSLGIKYEAATHFNLAVAYLRKDNLGLATIEFNTAIDTWPGSLYARRAQIALERQRGKTGLPSNDKPTE